VQPINANQHLQMPSPASIALLREEETKRQECARAASILFKCFKTTEASDPETFLAGAVAIMVKFGPKIAHAIANPVTGMPSTFKWLPSLAEVHEACEAEARHRERIARAQALPKFEDRGPAAHQRRSA
jgi:hypothetical protein